MMQFVNCHHFKPLIQLIDFISLRFVSSVQQTRTSLALSVRNV